MISKRDAPDLSNPFVPPLAPLVDQAQGTPWRDSPPTPWRRYFARRIDQFITLLALSVCGAFFLPDSLDRLLKAVIWRCLLLGTGVFIEAAWLAWWGTTPGKWIFGLRVRKADGGRLSYRQALGRSARVFGWGVGLALPGVAPLFALLGLLEVRKHGYASWDPPEDRRVEAKPLAPWRWAIAVLIAAGVAFIDLAGSMGLYFIS